MVVELMSPGRAVRSAAVPLPAHQQTFPVVEVSGPGRGEGPDAGLPCYYVKLGLTAPRRLTAEQVADAVRALPGRARLVVLSNAAAHQARPLVAALQFAGYSVAVEAQGTVWHDWLMDADRLLVTPRPPSVAAVTCGVRKQFRRFMANALRRRSNVALRVPVFDDVDLEWAEGVHLAYPEVSFFLSALGDYRWLCERTVERPKLADARVLPRLAWR